jgi:serine/threonine protein kinase
MHFNELFSFSLEYRVNDYMLVMEYADGGTLRNYLKKNFINLTWDNKFNMAHQLSCAVSCLHNEEIVHCDLVIYSLFFQLLLITFFHYSFNTYMF